MYFEQKQRITVYAVSSSIGLLLMLIPVLYEMYSPQMPYLVPLSQKVNNTIACGLVIAFSLPAIVEFNNYRWGRRVDRNLPRLLRDVTEAVRSGVTLPRALEEASQRDYGPISNELERAVSMFVMGGSWEESLMFLAKRLRRPSALRMSTILIEAHQTGGRIIEILKAGADLFSSLDEYKEEQFDNMRPYIVTVYMAVVIFLMISHVVLHQFIAPLYQVSLDANVQETGLLTGVLDANYYTSILFWASSIESVFGGLIAGKIGEKTLSAGLLHSVFLLIITLIFFNMNF
jgi:flagellar protein FlaJ